MKQKIITILIAIIALFGGGYTATNLGSIGTDQGYTATTTYSNLNAPKINGGTVAIKSTPGVFGSVIITGAVAGVMKFTDATSTTDVSSTTIATLPASLAAGTYTFDVAFGRGLYVTTSAGLVPTSTITYK